MSYFSKIGIVEESGRIPPDKRTPLTPHQCAQLKQNFPGIEIKVQPSLYRSYSDSEFEKENILLDDDLRDCDIILGIKEIPVDRLIDGKTYLFFSHTLKKQAHNQHLLKAILEKNIKLIDYECITDEQNNRLIAFGLYAGIVGAYNGLLTYLKKHKIIQLPPAHSLKDKDELMEVIASVRHKIGNLRVVLTGSGRVASGAMEVLKQAGFEATTPEHFLNGKQEGPIYVQLQSRDYHRHKENPQLFDRDDFHHNPSDYLSLFSPFTQKSDILIAGAFWHPDAPKLFTIHDMQNEHYSMKVIADITCDIKGSIPCTVKASTIEDPVYDFDPITEKVFPPYTDIGFTTVMAVDNLPCELPRDSSQYFGERMVRYVLPALIQSDTNGIIERATISNNGKLTPRFSYLQDYVDGKLFRHEK